MKVTEETFKENVLESTQPVLVFFYREKGCSFCTQMKPVILDYEKTHPAVTVACYELGAAPDNVTEGLVERFPTFAAYDGGKLIAKQDGVLTVEELHNTFTPEKIKPKTVGVEQATLLQLLTDESNIIDQIVPIQTHLKKVQKEIKRRRDLAAGKDACCDSCADGKDGFKGCH